VAILHGYLLASIFNDFYFKVRNQTDPSENRCSFEGNSELQQQGKKVQSKLDGCGS